MKQNALGRRDFLKGALVSGALAATSSVLASCSPTNPTGKASADGSITNTSGYQSADSTQQPWSFEIAPDPIAENDISEAIEADIVIVGAGTSGLATAASAAESGADVIVVSASTKPVARGGSNNATYCKAMEREGYDRLTPFMFQKEIFAASNQVDERKWYKHYNSSETAMNWVIDLTENAGYKVKVETGTPGDPTSLYYETCSIGWDLGEGMQADPSMTLSTGMMQPLLVGELARHLTEDLDSRIDFKTKAEQLVRDEGTGRV